MTVLYIALTTGIISTILGWLLGILSPSIIGKISEKTEKEKIKNIVFNDLKELKKRLGPVPFNIYPKYGKLDKNTFEWLKINSGIDFKEGLEKLSKELIKEEDIINHLNQEGLRKKTSTYFKKLNLFAIDSNLINLSIIGNDLIEKILEIKFYVTALNEDIDNYRDNFKMTFLPNITDINHMIISKQLDDQELMIAKRVIYIVDLINNVLLLEKIKTTTI
jgi:hypothetical protein